MADIYKNKKIISYISVILLCFPIFFCLFYRQIVVLGKWDFTVHNNFVEQFFDGTYKTMYPGYQLIVGVLAKIFHISVSLASVWILTICMIFSIFITYQILEVIGNLQEFSIIYMIAAVLINIIQPVFTKNIAPGFSSINGYVSPTQNVVKPISFYVLLLFFEIIISDKREVKKQILFLLALIVSCIFKPLFAMAFIPAMGIYIFIEFICNKFKNNSFSQNLYYTLIPLFLTGLFLIAQYIYMQQYSTVNHTQWDDGGIAVGFWVSWGMVVSNVPLSILFAYIFPIVFMIVFFSQKDFLSTMREKIWLKISTCYALVSFLYMSFLYQTGMELHCNFRNAWIYTFYLSYCLCVEMLIRWINEKGLRKNIRTWIAAGAFSCHVVFGVAMLLYKILV